LHPEDRARAEEQWHTSVVQGSALDCEFRIRSSRGEYRWFKARSTPIRAPDGAILRWYGTNTDVEELKQAAVMREQASARLLGILDGITDAFVALDEALTVTFLNGAAEVLLQRERSNTMGTRVAELSTADVGLVLEEKCRVALDQQESSTFKVRIGSANREPHLVRLYPHARGISLFFRRSTQPDT
jgi:PAS domain-containing protein